MERIAEKAGSEGRGQMQIPHDRSPLFLVTALTEPGGDRVHNDTVKPKPAERFFERLFHCGLYRLFCAGYINSPLPEPATRPHVSPKRKAVTESTKNDPPMHLRTRYGVARSGTRALVAWGILLAAAVLLPARVGAQQQEKPPQAQAQPQINVQVKVVNIVATVRNRKGDVVDNLGKDDFALEEDGKPQTIAYFSRDTDLPLTMGLLIDTSGSQQGVLADERSASRDFLNDVLREDRDKAFVIHFDRQVELLQDLTESRDKLQKALDLLGQPTLTRRGDEQEQRPDQFPDPRAQRGQAGFAGTTLYDAVFLASDEVIKKQQGRKVLFVLSDGVDRGSKESIEDAIMAAQRVDAAIYAIYFAGEQRNQNPFGFGGPGGFGGRRGGGGGRYPQEERPDGKKILERMAQETGGQLFEVSKKQPVADIYSSIAQQLRTQYSLGYSPAADVALGYHKLHLTMKQKDLTVQAREGYYAER